MQAQEKRVFAFSRLFSFKINSHHIDPTREKDREFAICYYFIMLLLRALCAAVYIVCAHNICHARAHAASRFKRKRALCFCFYAIWRREAYEE